MDLRRYDRIKSWWLLHLKNKTQKNIIVREIELDDEKN